MYRFTMYQPKGESEFQKEGIQIVGDSKPFIKESQPQSKIIKVKASTFS